MIRREMINKDDGIVVLSLFDGMSCGQIALERAGIKVKTYYASEIDKYAIQVTQKNYPNTIQLGDVRNVFAKDLPKIDLLIGGSPCQGFSFAGKGLNFDDPRSKLFFEFVRLKNECKPTYYLLENVRMKKEFESVFNEYIGVKPVVINSALVSAQNRVRLYWTNIGLISDGLFGEFISGIRQPNDKMIMLKDILQQQADDKYFIKTFTENQLNKFENINIDESKAGCLTEVQGRGGSSDEYISMIKKISILNDRQQSNLKLPNEKANTFLSTSWKGSQANGMTLVVVEDFYANRGNRIYEEKAPTIRADRSGLKVADKSPCLHGFEHGTNGQFNKQLINGGLVRRLTPIECERLQTVPDNYTDCVSDSQRYRMLGNGWTVDVIAHIFSYLPFPHTH